MNLLNLSTKALLDYGTYTIENRALPDFRDGLKPVHRRIIWSMYKEKFFSNSNMRKSARTVGDTMGKYHPHGDTGIYKSMVTLANLPEPLLDTQGNWGSYTDEAAASRYTECRLSKYAEKCLLDKNNLEIMPLVDNYDGEFNEPVFLPATLPNLVINGTEGIAVGCGNLIPSFSLDSVKQIIVLALNKKINESHCKKILKFKFKYGGELSPNQDLLTYFKTGRLSIKFNPRINREDFEITMSSMAPRFNLNKFIEKISKIKEIKSIDDYSARNKFDIRISLDKKLSRNNLDKISNKLIEQSQSSLPCNTRTTRRDIESITFKTLSIVELIEDWISWRKDYEQKVVDNLIKKEKQKLSYQKLMLMASNNKKIILESLDKKNPEKYLETTLNIKPKHAETILSLQVRKLSKIEKAPIKEKINNHKQTIKNLKKDNLTKRIENYLN